MGGWRRAGSFDVAANRCPGDRRQFYFDAALCQTRHAKDLLPFCDEIVRRPSFKTDLTKRLAAGNPQRATFGEYLGDCRFLDEGYLTRRLDFWVNTLKLGRFDLVIADFAPLAVLAARSLGIPCVTVGVGYFVPPHQLDAFPVIFEEHQTRIYDEADIVAVINRAGGPLGIAPLAHLPELFACDHQLVCSLPMFDPYDGLRSEPLLPPITETARVRAADGKEIHVYFSTTELADPSAVEALCSFRQPTRIFAPGIKPDIANRLAAGGVTVLTEPAPLDEIARRTRLIVHSAQHGIMCLALAAGIPQVALPQHIEQRYNAIKAERAGILRQPIAGEDVGQALQALVAESYDDQGMWVRAQELSREVAPVFARNLRRLIRRRLMML